MFKVFLFSVSFGFLSVPVLSMEVGNDRLSEVVAELERCTQLEFYGGNCYCVSLDGNKRGFNSNVLKKALEQKIARETFNKPQFPVLGDVFQQIFKCFLNSKKKIAFDSFNGLVRELIFRLHMVLNFENFLKTVRFNSPGDDSFVLPEDYWQAEGAYFDEDKDSMTFYVHGSYAPKNQVSPLQAIQEIEKVPTVLDCSGAAMAHAYLSLSTAVPPGKFNAFFTDGRKLFLSTFRANFFDEGKDEFVENPIFEEGILQEKTISDLAELTPGDIVYFENHPEYEDINPLGSASGEYAVYLGYSALNNRMFVGHGLTRCSFDKAIASLEEEFQDSMRLIPKCDRPKTLRNKDKNAKYKGTDILGKTYPSLSTTIFEIGAFRSGAAPHVKTLTK